MPPCLGSYQLNYNSDGVKVFFPPIFENLVDVKWYIEVALGVPLWLSRLGIQHCHCSSFSCCCCFCSGDSIPGSGNIHIPYSWPKRKRKVALIVISFITRRDKTSAVCFNFIPDIHHLFISFAYFFIWCFFSTFQWDVNLFVKVIQRKNSYRLFGVDVSIVLKLSNLGTILSVFCLSLSVASKHGWALDL